MKFLMTYILAGTLLLVFGLILVSRLGYTFVQEHHSIENWSKPTIQQFKSLLETIIVSTTNFYSARDSG